MSLLIFMFWYFIPCVALIILILFPIAWLASTGYDKILSKSYFQNSTQIWKKLIIIIVGPILIVCFFFFIIEAGLS